jgi:hypothetical protein
MKRTALFAHASGSAASSRGVFILIHDATRTWDQRELGGKMADPEVHHQVRTTCRSSPR